MGLINTIGNAINGGKVADTLQQNISDVSNAFNENTGTKGFLDAHNAGMQTAGALSNMAGVNATNQAMDASRASGTSKAASALNASNAASNAAVNSVQSMYRTGVSNAMQQQSAKVSAALNRASLASNQAKTEYAASQAMLAQAQSFLSGALAFYNSNLRGAVTIADPYPSENNKPAPVNPAPTAGYNAALGANALSDERCKDIPEQATSTDAMSQIESIIYKYTDEAQKEYGADSDNHVGVTAQSVEKIWPECVHTDENGIKSLDKQKLLESVTAGIAALSKEIESLK